MKLVQIPDSRVSKKVMVALIIGKHFNGLFPSQFFVHISTLFSVSPNNFLTLSHTHILPVPRENSNKPVNDEFLMFMKTEKSHIFCYINILPPKELRT